MDSLIASPVTLGLLVLNIAASLIAFGNAAFMSQNILWVVVGFLTGIIGIPESNRIRLGLGLRYLSTG